MINILVTGGGGFVGKHVLNCLDQFECNVTLITSKNKAHFSKYSNVNKIIQSKDLFLESEDWFVECLQGVDIVIHLAWYANPNDYLTNQKNVDCLSGTVNFGKAFCRVPARKFVGVGTCIEYANFDKPVFSSDPLAPQSLYGSCKASAYFILRSLFRLNDKEFSWCRLFFLYGEGQSKQKLHGYIEDRIRNNQAVELSSGEQRKDFIDVKEAAREIVKVAFSNYEGAYNVCSGSGQSVKEVALNIVEKIGGSHLLKFGARPSSPMDMKDIIGVRDTINKTSNENN